MGHLSPAPVVVNRVNGWLVSGLRSPVVLSIVGYGELAGRVGGDGDEVDVGACKLLRRTIDRRSKGILSMQHVTSTIVLATLQQRS